MNRRVRVLLGVTLVAGLFVGTISACGIPDSSEVVAVKPGPSAGLTSGAENAPTRPERKDTSNAGKFIENYLQAAAGDLKGAADRARDFIAPSARYRFRPPKEIHVVHLIEPPLAINTGSVSVTVKVQEVGVISGPNGILEPPVSSAGVTKYNFTVDSLRGPYGLYVTEMPQVLLLSDTALNTYYERRVIYFWNRDRTALVPDIRYMSPSIPKELQPTEIVKWLAAGPSPWLSAAVDALPDNTEVAGNVPAVSNDTLQVNLSGVTLPPDDPTALDRLRRQLMWSLRPYLPSQLDLRFDNQPQGPFSGTDYQSSNLAVFFRDRPERFAVYDGHVRRLAQLGSPLAQSVPAASDQARTGAEEVPPVPLITDDVNYNVRSAALSASGDRTYAALVVNEGKKQVLKVGTALTGQTAVFRRAVLPGVPGRPVWAITSPRKPASAVGLIVVDRKLYSFGIGRPVTEVDWPAIPTGVQAVSAAPDGRRIAVIARGRLYLAVLTAAGKTVQLSPPRSIRVQLTNLSAVDWSSEGFVVVAGEDDSNRIAINDVSIDGVLQTPRAPNLGTARITQLVAYPANPVINSRDANYVAYEANNLAYNLVGDPTLITDEDVLGPRPSPPPHAPPRSPFYLN